MATKAQGGGKGEIDQRCNSVETGAEWRCVHSLLEMVEYIDARTSETRPAAF